MKKCTAVFLIVFLFGLVPVTIAESPPSLPEPEAELELIQNSIVGNADGTGELQFHDLVKILKESGKVLSQIRLPYNQSKEELKIDIARTIKSDGKIVPMDINLIQDTAPLERIPFFSDIRLRQFVLPNVSVGDFIELKYTIRIKEAIVPGVFTTFFSYPLGKMTLRSRLIINLPQILKPRYVVTIPGLPQPTILNEGDRTIYQWAPDPVVLSHGHELAIPPPFDVDPYVFFSTMESWKQLTQWYVPLFEGTLKEPTDQIQRKAEELIQGIENELEKIKAIFRYVAQEVEYIGISLGESAWRPYPPDYVLTHRYGDCKGKSALLS